MTEDPLPGGVAGDDDSVQGHLRSSMFSGNASNHAAWQQSCSRRFKDEIEQMMNDFDSKQIHLCFDRMNSSSQTSLRIKIIDRDAIVSTELDGDEAGSLYYRLTGDTAFLSNCESIRSHLNP